MDYAALTFAKINDGFGFELYDGVDETSCQASGNSKWIGTTVTEAGGLWNGVISQEMALEEDWNPSHGSFGRIGACYLRFRTLLLVASVHETLMSSLIGYRWDGGLKQRWECKLRFKGFLMLAMLSQANGMNAEQANELVPKIVDLTQAATSAAQATSTMIQTFQVGKGGGHRFGDGARVLKAPDTFDTDDPVRYSLWREQFMNWLVFCDGRYGDLIKDVENLDTVGPMQALEPDVQDLATKLYSILASYLRGPAFQVPGCQMTLQSVQCFDAPTRRHLEMIMEDDITYSKLKEKLILLDKNTKAWSGDGFLRNLQQLQNPSTSSTSYQGPAPIEVDQVQFGQKGKGKSKGKSKGKKGGWFGIPYGGKAGGVKNGSKSKGKNKGKKGKGKHKGKQKGKGYGGNNNSCRICGQFGHWSNECPNKGNVSQVNASHTQDTQAGQVAGDGASTVASSIPRRASTASTVSSQPSTKIRMVKMYSVATPPESQPACYELRSDGENSVDWYSVRMVSTVCFNMAAKDEVDEGSMGEMNDSLMDWYDDQNSPMDQVQVSEDMDVYHVRSAPLHDGQLIAQNSGADISLLPYSMADRGHDGDRRFSRTVLEDAQGGRLQTFGRRSAQIEVEDQSHDLVVIENDFVAWNVKCPLVSPGRLLHRGWTMTPTPTAPAGVSLLAPDRQCEIPLQFKRNSLAVFAHIRVVNIADGCPDPPEQPVPPSLTCPMTCIDEEDEDEGEGMGYKPYKLVVQTVIQPYKELTDRIFRRGWTMTENGNPLIIVPRTNKYLNPNILFPWGERPRRSTLIQLPDFTWEVVEHCVPYFTKLNYEEEIVELGGREGFVLTMLRKKEEPISVFGTLQDETSVGASGVQADASDFAFQPEAAVPLELQEGLKPEELAQAHPGGVLSSDDSGGFEWTFENKDPLVVNGNVVTHSE
eukprot:s3061_g9.t1